MWVSVTISDLNTLPKGTVATFDGKARVVEDLYNRQLALRKVKKRGVQKIAISLTSEPNVNKISRPIKGYSPVCVVRRTYNFESFEGLTDTEQFEEILEIIAKNVANVAETLGWEPGIFDEIRQTILATDFNHAYFEGSLKWSRDKLHKAGVEVCMKPTGASISVVFWNKMNVSVRKVELIVVHPARLFIKPLIGLTKWLNNSDFELTDSKNQIHFVASIDKMAPTVSITPTVDTLDGVIDDLLIASTSTNKEQILGLLRDRNAGA